MTEPPYGAQPPGWTPPPQGYYQPPPPTPGNATTALVLGILGLVFCGPFTAIPAWIVGRNAVREIDASQGRLGGRGTAQAGYVLGIIGTVLAAVSLVIVIGVFALGSVFVSHVDDGGGYQEPTTPYSP